MCYALLTKSIYTAKLSFNDLLLKVNYNVYHFKFKTLLKLAKNVTIYMKHVEQFISHMYSIVQLVLHICLPNVTRLFHDDTNVS